MNNKTDWNNCVSGKELGMLLKLLAMDVVIMEMSYFQKLNSIKCAIICSYVFSDEEDSFEIFPEDMHEIFNELEKAGLGDDASYKEEVAYANIMNWIAQKRGYFGKFDLNEMLFLPQPNSEGIVS